MTPPPDEPVQGNDCPTAIDRCVGARIRLRREELAVSMEELAGRMDLSLQQMDEYESGLRRIDAVMLFEAAQSLDVPIGYFFDEVAAFDDSQLPAPYGDYTALPSASADLKRDVLNLVRFYFAISDPVGRRKILDLARDMAETAV